MIKQVHPNSIISYHELKTAERYKLILDLLEKEFQPLTDRQIKDKLGFTDMNSVRPRITELLTIRMNPTTHWDDGVLEECENVICPITNRKVRTIRLKDKYREFIRQKSGQLALF